MLKLQTFIKENDNFRELLSEKPYAIKIQEDEHFALFKYNQIDSSFNLELVRECRGIILDKSDWSIAFHGFPKFGNYGESYVPDLDWETTSVQEKRDGSFIGIFYNKYTASWQLKTSGMINAKDAELMDNVFGIKNYYDLVMYTLDKMNVSIGSIVNMVEKEYSIICEVTSPANKIVIPYKDFTLTHLATKHNKTGKEVELMIGLPKPLWYPLTTLDECINSANELPFSEEGYVCVDRDLNRLKIKSPAYLTIHHLRGEGTLVPRRVLDLIRMNEHEEFLVYYEEFRSIFDEMETKYNTFIENLQVDLIEAKYFFKNDRKVFAEWATKQIMPSILFAFYDGKIKKANEGLEGLSSEKLLRYL